MNKIREKIKNFGERLAIKEMRKATEVAQYVVKNLAVCPEYADTFECKKLELNEKLHLLWVEIICSLFGITNNES